MDLTPYGFPHSDTYGSTLIRQLTVFFRGLYVLLRRHVPRHPPRALSRLLPNIILKISEEISFFWKTTFVVFLLSYESFFILRLFADF